MILVRKAALAKRWKTLLCYSTFEAKAKIKIDQRCNFISVLNSSVHVSTDEWYKKIYQLPLSFHFWLKANTKACGNKSCESTNPQISIWVKWSALRQLAIETGENWIESPVQSVKKFDFTRLSLSNPQSGQSLFLLHDSNSPSLSLFRRFIYSIAFESLLDLQKYLTRTDIIWKHKFKVFGFEEKCKKTFFS